MAKFIKFKTYCEVEAQGVLETVFKADAVYELADESAERWIRRGLAFEVEGPEKPAKQKAKAKPKTTPKAPKE